MWRRDIWARSTVPWERPRHLYYYSEALKVDKCTLNAPDTAAAAVEFYGTIDHRYIIYGICYRRYFAVYQPLNQGEEGGREVLISGCKSQVHYEIFDGYKRIVVHMYFQEIVLSNLKRVLDKHNAIVRSFVNSCYLYIHYIIYTHVSANLLQYGYLKRGDTHGT